MRGLFSFPPNILGKRVTLSVGKNIKELQLQLKEISVASEADKKQSGAKRTNHRTALKFEKMCRQFLCSDWLATILST